MSEDMLLQDQPLGHKLIKKGFWLYLFMLLTAPVGYIIKVLISNTLSVEDVGIFYSVLGLLVLVSSYNDLGLTEALQYYLPKYWIKKEYNNYKTILYVTIFAQLLTGVSISLALYFGADWLAIHHFGSLESAGVLKTLCWFFLGINFIQVAASVYTAFQDTLASSLVEFVKQYTVLWFTLFFWITHTLTLSNYSLSRIIGVLASMIFSLIWFQKRYGYTLKNWSFSPNTGLITKQIKYAVWIFLWANVTTLFSQVDQQIIIHFLGAVSAGYYSNYWSMITIYTLITTPLLVLISPIVIELITRKEHKKFSLFQNILYKYLSLFWVSLGAVFFVLWEPIAVVLFGEKFLYSGTLIWYMWLFLVFSMLYTINYGIMAWLGLAKERVKTLALGLLVNIILNLVFILVFGWGLVWAVVASAVSWVFLRLYSLYYVYGYQKIHFDWYFLSKNILVIIGLISLMSIYAWKIFVLNDSVRFLNLWYLFLICFIYYCIIAAVNYKSIYILIGEIWKINKPNK